jgi:hypothetical protein
MGRYSQRKITVARAIADVLFFGAVLYAPHWAIPALMALVCMFAFVNFYEAILGGLIFDMLFGSPLVWLYGFPFIFTLGALLGLLFTETLKTRLRLDAFQD